MTVDSFGPVFRAAREAKGLTQKDVADHLKLDHTYVSKMESGKASMPDLDTLLKWSFYIGAKKIIENFVISYPAPVEVQPKRAA